MTVHDLIRRLRLFPPDAIVGFNLSQGKELDPIEGCRLTSGTRTESIAAPSYRISKSGIIPLVILYDSNSRH